MTSRTPLRAAALFLAAGALLALPAAASAGVAVHAGTPTCAQLGYTHQIMFSPAKSGEKTTGDVTAALTVLDHPLGVFLSWATSAPIDAVIVKGGPDAHVYTYPGESSGDFGLTAPSDGILSTHDPEKAAVCWDDKKPLGKAPVPQDGDVPLGPDGFTAPPEGDAPPAPQPPAGPPAAGGDVPAPGAAAAGTSRLELRAGCARRKVKATITGAEIASVVFRLDGRKVKTVAGAGTFAVKRAALRAGRHRITAKVTYSAASGTAAVRHAVKVKRCRAR